MDTITSIEKKYTELVDQFCSDEICKIARNYPFIDHNQAPAPFLPIIGSGYDCAKIKVAVYGMETYHWHDLSKFVDKFQRAKKDGKANPLAIVKAYTDGNINGERNDNHKVQRFHVHHGTEYDNGSSFGFWTFAYSALAYIYYGTNDIEKLKSDPDKLKSFIWGNVNSYEKYKVTWKNLGVDSNKTLDKKTDWKKVFDSASRYFDSATPILQYARPQIMVVFYWGMTREWLTGDKDKKWQDSEKVDLHWEQFNCKKKEILSQYIKCYYLSQTGTYVLKTMHPRGMPSKGVKKDKWLAAINHAINIIKENLQFPSAG